LDNLDHSDRPDENTQRPGRLKSFFARLKPARSQEPEPSKPRKRSRGIPVVITLLLLALSGLGIYWSRAPDLFDVQETIQRRAANSNQNIVTGFATTGTLIEVAERLLNKPGGYLSNDILPPGVLMDNMPNWEFGILVQIRDLARSLRNDMSRAQTQSQANPDLAIAEPQFSVNSYAWLFPAAETEYQKGIEALERYLAGVADTANSQAQFFARADNLRNWLRIVASRLGSLSQRLSASVGQQRINTDLAGDAEATQSTPLADQVEIKTPWLEVDNVFYEARGTSWALIHFLRAAEIDFKEVLEKKNALRSVQQIIRELEGTQRTVWSPVVLNGSDFGFTANYSLVMSSYIARANAGIIDLTNLLSQG
jgi:hypothetical protein